MPNLPLIRLMMGPGTLPSQGKDRMDFLRYNETISGKPRLSGQEMLAAIPELAGFARLDIDEQNPHEIGSPDNLRKIALRAEEALARPEIDGLVFIQGTNSLEETAYFLNLSVHTGKPLIITGAQRPFTALSTDAHVNLVDAIRVAATPEAAGKGVLAVTNGEINAARDVTKTSTYKLHTFRARDMGIVGYADPDRITLYRAPVRRHTAASEFDLSGVEKMPPVEILYVHGASRPELARAAADIGSKGIVAAGTGAGSLGDLRGELKKIAEEGVIVVRSARVGEGRVVKDDNWQEPGMVAADNLNPQKAAILLTIALTKTSDPDEIQRIFDTY
jgi:L-asparaginase